MPVSPALLEAAVFFQNTIPSQPCRKFAAVFRAFIGGIMTDTTVPGRAGVRSDSRYFYFQMSLVCMAVAFLGFWPSYWGRMVAGTLHEAPISHIHGIVFFGWSLYIVYQSWLGASGQVARHRAIGLIGVSFATAMAIFGVMVSIQVMHELTARGKGAYGVYLASISLSNITLFAALIVFALMNLRRPEWHKRAMIMAAISILGAPLARPLMVNLHMPPPALLSDWLVCVLALLPMAHDWRTRGTVHPANWIAFAAILAVRLVRIPMADTVAWHDFAGWLSGLSG